MTRQMIEEMKDTRSHVDCVGPRRESILPETRLLREKTMKKTCFAIALVGLLATGCSYRGYYLVDSDQTYEIGADPQSARAADDIYEAAFQLCRDKHSAGYAVQQAPRFDRHGNLVGRFLCQGPIDLRLAAKYARRTPILEENPTNKGATLNYGGGFL